MHNLTISDPPLFKQRVPETLSGPDAGGYQHPPAPPVFQSLYERLLSLLRVERPRHANARSW